MLYFPHLFLALYERRSYVTMVTFSRYHNYTVINFKLYIPEAEPLDSAFYTFFLLYNLIWNAELEGASKLSLYNTDRTSNETITITIGNA